jgi:DDE superfamily endonuclease
MLRLLGEGVQKQLTVCSLCPLMMRCKITLYNCFQCNTLFGYLHSPSFYVTLHSLLIKYIYFAFEYAQVPSSEQEWKKVCKEFFEQWNFPNCVGALDGKHVAILPPKDSGSMYYNYKHFNSVVMMALVDASYRFLYVDVGSYGRTSDGGVFNNCSLATALDTGMLNIPNECQPPGYSIALPHAIVADDAFALKTYIMKPYASRGLTGDQRVYNYRLSRARRVVENAFGILSSRFRVFGRPISLAPEKVQFVVMAACCVHNFLLRDKASTSIYVGDNDDDTSCNLQDVGKQCSNRTSNKAMAVRDEYCRYFNSASGSVSWQLDAIR